MVNFRLPCPTSLAFLLISGLIKSSYGSESCACEAETHGFTIDCQDTDAMIQGLASLQSNGCIEDCSSEICRKNYFIIQSHHDYCPEEGLPSVVEDGLHDFEGVCEDCEILRRPNPNFPLCPVVSCQMNGPGEEAHETLMANECLVDCSSQTCVDSFRVLVGKQPFVRLCTDSVTEQACRDCISPLSCFFISNIAFL